MKKILDKYLFSRFSIQMLASLVTVLLFAIVITVVRDSATPVENTGIQKWIWGFRQVSSPDSSINTIEAMAKEQWNIPFYILFLLSMLAWFISIAVFSFVTGAIVNAIRNRQQKVDDGTVRYHFRNHAIIIGWDFQGTTVIKKLLTDPSIKELLIVSGQKAQDIRRELKMVMTSSELSHIYIYHSNIHLKSTLKSLFAELCRVIVILGEKNSVDNNGGNLLITGLLSESIHTSRLYKERPDKIKLYLQIEDITLFQQTRNMKLPANTDSVFDVEIFNFYESWAWQCWSAHTDNEAETYLPLRYRPETVNAELFVIGATSMGKALVSYAMPLMNYGNDSKHNHITIFDAKPDAGDFLPRTDMLDALPELQIRHIPCSGCSDEADAIMLEAAEQQENSVTVVIAIDNPDEAVKTYLRLSNKLRRHKISVLLYQNTSLANCPDKKYLQTGGDCTILRYFGMTDYVPWLNAERLEMGKAVNFYYGVSSELPKGNDPHIVGAAPSLWNQKQADELWNNMDLWKKWSSINSGDSFKEKAAAFANCSSDSSTCTALLHAEHNRWWTERILAGWIPGPRDNSQFIHPALVPADQLPADVADLDKINIAAMAKCGFLEAEKQSV